MGLLSKIVDIGASFDWISPLGQIIGEAAGGQRGLAADMRCYGGSANQLMRALKAHGVGVHMGTSFIQGDTLVFNVDIEDWDIAQAYLAKWGCLA